MGAYPKDLHLVAHIGLHKTASSFVQSALSARRHELIQHGVLYPSTGMVGDERLRTRSGAQSGQLRLAFPQMRKKLMGDLAREVPRGVDTVLLSSEDLSHSRFDPEVHFELLAAFRSVTVIAVVRRQDDWIESLYKQIVDQHGNFETRSFADFLAEEGPGLLDFYTRLAPWRDFVGPENFRVLSYDDLAGGAAIGRRILDIAGVPADDLGDFPGVEVPRYASARGIDTLGLRILNGYRLQDRDIRNRAAREIYAAAPSAEVELMTPEMRAGIMDRYAAVNERIEAEWCAEPVPGFRFGREPRQTESGGPSTRELCDYLDRVFAACDHARGADDEALAAAVGEDDQVGETG